MNTILTSLILGFGLLGTPTAPNAVPAPKAGGCCDAAACCSKPCCDNGCSCADCAACCGATCCPTAG